jgi:hypothetical protein
VVAVILEEITDQNREAVLAPPGFYRRLGFVATGEFGDHGEVIARLGLPSG